MWQQDRVTRQLSKVDVFFNLYPHVFFINGELQLFCSRDNVRAQWGTRVHRSDGHHQCKKFGPDSWLWDTWSMVSHHLSTHNYSINEAGLHEPPLGRRQLASEQSGLACLSTVAYTFETSCSIPRIWKKKRCVLVTYPDMCLLWFIL